MGLKANELVWRTLLDSAIAGTRYWQSLADLAFEAGVPLTTTHLATRKLSEIGAIAQYRAGGLSVVSPDKLATLLCAWRNLHKDTIAKTTRAAAQDYVSSGAPHALGGPDAAVHMLGGTNKVADYSQSILYIPQAARKHSWPTGDEIRVLEMDERAALNWDGYSSFSQTYADLFATPGWQATEFRLALKAALLPERDWEEDSR